MFDGMPLHALVVHGPLALGVLAPIVALILWGAIAGRYLHHRVWWLVVFLHFGAFAGAVVAVETGEDEHDKVQEIVGHDTVHAHEERGETYRNALGGMLLLSALAGFLFGNRKWGMRLAGLTVAAGFATAYLALGVGHSGGLLVYEHGAASYYVEGTGPRGIRAAPGDSLEVDSAETHTHADGTEHEH